MFVKESRDELNPTVVTNAPVVTRPRPARSLKDYLALTIATCGVGYLPLAPGTWGSLVGIGVYVVVRGIAMKLFFGADAGRNFTLIHVYYAVVAFELVVLVVITLFGIWAASRTEKLSGRKA